MYCTDPNPSSECPQAIPLATMCKKLVMLEGEKKTKKKDQSHFFEIITNFSRVCRCINTANIIHLNAIYLKHNLKLLKHFF